MLNDKMPRRTFLRGAMATAALSNAPSWSQTDAGTPTQLFLGTGGDGIYRARWNPATGELGMPELAVATPKPTFLALHPHLPVMYACNEREGADAAVSAFALDRGQGTLTAIGTTPTHGDDPCYVSVDRTGKLLFAANYTGGSLAAFALDAGGKPAPAARVFACAGSGLCGALGPVKERQDAPHIHCAVISPDNRFVLACDLGDDAILIFPIAPGTGKPLHDPVRVAARPGSGPRHLTFTPAGTGFYCVHELDCTVDFYRWSVHGGTPHAELVPGSATDLRPASAAGNKGDTAAEVAITRNGQFLYASTRGADLLSSFRIDHGTGKLTELQQIACGGRGPRFFALDPTERWLLCAHQDGNSVTTFARDAKTGELTQRSTQTVTSPQCIVWI